MPRLQALDPATATGQAKELLDGVQKKMGAVPNIMRTMAQSPAVLQAYLGFSGALSGGLLPASLRERIALVVGERNNCEYCLAAHSKIGQMTGLSDDEILASRRVEVADPKVQAVLKFARRLVDERGWVSDADLESLRAQGYGDGEIAEIVATVSINIFTNYFNHTAGTEVDFPPVPALAEA